MIKYQLDNKVGYIVDEYDRPGGPEKHAEQMAYQKLPEGAKIIALYSERSLCTGAKGCANFFAGKVSADRIYYSFNEEWNAFTRSSGRGVATNTIRDRMRAWGANEDDLFPQR